MKEKNVVLRRVVLAAVALLIVAGSVLAADIEVNITPHHLSLTDGYTRFVRCNVSPIVEGVAPGDCSLAIDGMSVLAIKVESHIELHDKTVVFFDCDEVRDMLAGKMGEVTLTLSLESADGTTISGTDSIIVTE